MSLNTIDFVKNIIDSGYTHLCVVPCSFAKNLINEVINNKNIEYLPAASEAVACSIAAGLKMAGKKPIVIIQSSGMTNMGSCITSLLKPYGITFPIITSWRNYKAGDSEIQHEHLANNLTNLISAYGYQYQILDHQNLNLAINQINESNNKNIICIIKKDTFDQVELDKKHKQDLSAYIPRSKYLLALNERFKNENVLFIGTTGNTSREIYKFMTETKNFYMAGNMGGALSLGFGAAKAGKKVIVCGGDAEFVMHMGGLTTAGRDSKLINLTYILFDNEQNKSTGGQNTYQGHLDYIGIAKSIGFNVVENAITTLEEFKIKIMPISGLNFLYVKCDIDNETPRPPLHKVKINEF